MIGHTGPLQPRLHDGRGWAPDHQVMDCEHCPVCYPGSQSPLLDAPRHVVERIYADLRKRSAMAAGQLPCQADPDKWFDDRIHRAKAECLGLDTGAVPCPILAQCAVAALLGREEHGIWGGLSPRDRRAVHRGRY